MLKIKFFNARIFALLLLVIAANEIQNECDLLFAKHPKDFKKKGITDKILKYNHKRCLEKVIGENQPLISDIIGNKTEQLSSIRQKYLSNANVDKFISPAFKWGENQNYIFIQIEFKENHTDKALICNQLEEESFEFLSDSSIIHFEGYCLD